MVGGQWAAAVGLRPVLQVCCEKALLQWDEEFLGKHAQEDGGMTYVKKLTGAFVNYISYCNKHRIQAYKTAAEVEAQSSQARPPTTHCPPTTPRPAHCRPLPPTAAPLLPTAAPLPSPATPLPPIAPQCRTPQRQRLSHPRSLRARRARGHRHQALRCRRSR